jgi:hypothetical protein
MSGGLLFPSNLADTASGSAQSFASNVSAPALIAAGLTGATAASRYAGATTSGAPASGTFLKGDFIVDQTGTVWVCTTAGTPGSWTNVGSQGNVVTSVFGRTGAITAQSGDYTAAQVTNAADKSSASQQTFTGNMRTPSLGIGVDPDGTSGNLTLAGSATVQGGTINLNGSAGSGIVITNTASTGNTAILSKVAGDSNYRWYVGVDGQTFWGPGNAAQDLRLRRSGTKAAILDDTAGGAADLTVTGNLTVTGALSAAPTTFFASGARNAAAYERTIMTVSNTVTLPSAPVTGTTNVIQNQALSSAAANLVTIARGGSDTITNLGTTGATSITIPQGSVVTLAYNAAVWTVVAIDYLAKPWCKVCGINSVATSSSGASMQLQQIANGYGMYVSSGNIIVPVTGLYSIEGSVGTFGNGVGLNAYIVINGSVGQNLGMVSTASNGGNVSVMPIATEFTASAGQTVTVNIATPGGGATILNGNAGEGFTVRYLGPS